MLLKTLEYCQYADQPKHWSLEGCSFGDINLIVGKNATGKTKALNIIRGLGYLLSEHGPLKYSTGEYKVEFVQEDQKLQYILKYENAEVVREEFISGENSLMKREPDGTGLIYSSPLKKKIKFQTSTNLIAALSKRDSIQHPFLDGLYNWANGVIHFLFGTTLGKETVVSIKGDFKEKKESDLKDTNKAVVAFKKGRDRFGDPFVSAVMEDMRSIGYEIEEIDCAPPEIIHIPDGPLMLPEPVWLLVKETDLSASTNQKDMSQGMFRALSLLIHLNYAYLTDIPSCVLVDDIGEGLDYDRSSSLIKMVIKKARMKSIQLIMSTNDRFVMNNVPLEYWTIIHREGNRSRCFNYRNSPSLFDEFEMTGLNNFDLFSSDFLIKHLKDNGKDRDIH